ncbi:hypothetical protein EDB83DRAFT_2327240 [Lactarius deliciosus]|nr:hypothetical protein EDB83DRAFT_2327240 [Lactarius deliciosus]
MGLDIIYESPAAGELPDGWNIEFPSVEASRHVKHPKYIPVGPDIIYESPAAAELPDGRNIEFSSVEATRHGNHPKLIPVGLDIIYKSPAAGELPDGWNIEFPSIEATTHIKHPKLIPMGLILLWNKYTPNRRQVAHEFCKNLGHQPTTLAERPDLSTWQNPKMFDSDTTDASTSKRKGKAKSQATPAHFSYFSQAKPTPSTIASLASMSINATKTAPPAPPGGIVPAVTGGFKGSPPTPFSGDRTKSLEFLREFRHFRLLNEDHEIMINPYKRTLLALSLIHGPAVNDWVDSQDQEAERLMNHPTNPVLRTDPILWTLFETAFKAAWTDTLSKQNTYQQLMNLEMSRDRHGTSKAMLWSIGTSFLRWKRSFRHMYDNPGPTFSSEEPTPHPSATPVFAHRGGVEIGSGGNSHQRLGLRVDDYKRIDNCGQVIVRVILEHCGEEMPVNWVNVKVGV